MGLIKKIARNTGILFISNIISKFFGFLYTIYMARYLGAEGFGIISFALAFTGMFAILADMGLQPLTIREIARNPELTEKYLGNVAVIIFYSIYYRENRHRPINSSLMLFTKYLI